MTEQTRTDQTNRTISVDRLREMLEAGEPVTVVDVRPLDEREEWAIPGSIHADAHDELWEGQPGALADLALPKDRTVVTVCGAGRTSLLAAEQLEKMGYSAYSLDGGMKSWSVAWNTATVDIPGSEATVLQVRRTGKGCLSYIVANGGRAAVIDASLPAQVYLELAERRGWRIESVIDTHIHADHLSRARDLAERTGARLYLPEQKRASYSFTPLRSGEVVDVGSSKIETISTPGHTPESATYRLDDRAIFTGDTLFLTSVGRPDLEATREEARQRATALYGTLQKLVALDPSTLVLPGHTAEPIEFDGRPLAGSIGEIRERVELLSLSEEEFVERVTRGMPKTPENHGRIIELNETGSELTDSLTELEEGANRCAVN